MHVSHVIRKLRKIICFEGPLICLSFALQTTADHDDLINPESEKSI